MTNEEAIECNKNLRMYMQITDKNSSHKFLEENYIALDMAIKALEQQPCEDTINREDALMALTGEWTEITDEIIHRFIKRIKKLPSVTPQPKTGRWIPVSERLPERPYGCLVTVMDTNPMTFDEFENIYPDFVGWDGENWNDADGYSIPFEVIAWMPLPKPYTAESEEVK